MILKIKRKLYQLFLKTPILSRYSRKWYKKLGVKGTEYYHLSSNITFVGDYNLLTMEKDLSSEKVHYCT